VHEGNYAVYGTRRVWRQLCREGIEVGRDRVGRLMAELGLTGATRTKKVRTTVPAAVSERPADLVERVFTAVAPDHLWVADLTYVWTRAGFCYTALIIDAFSRRIVGWRVSSSLRTDLALDALEMAIFTRGGGDLDGLIHHSDRGGQGGINRSSQHLETEVCSRWVCESDDGRSRRCVARSGRQADHRRHDERTGSASGRRSLVA
jgi:putative transposase